MNKVDDPWIGEVADGPADPELAPEGLAPYLHERRGNESWRGCNVTMPHKQVIAPLVDRLDPLAAKVGEQLLVPPTAVVPSGTVPVTTTTSMP